MKTEDGKIKATTDHGEDLIADVVLFATGTYLVTHISDIELEVNAYFF